MRVLLLTPPMTQVNTPYPATAYLTGFLRGRGHDAVQADPAIELLLKLLSRDGIRTIESELKRRFPPSAPAASRSIRFFLQEADRYRDTTEAVVRFLQGKDPSLAHRIVSDDFLPRGPRFEGLAQWDAVGGDGIRWAFGAFGLADLAQHMASLYIDDLADVLKDGIDARFGLSRYAEKIAESAPSFDPIREALLASPSLIDTYLDGITESLLLEHRPEIIGLTVPFPGNVYGAFRMAKRFKELAPNVPIVLGGGYVNTELRELSDLRVFDYIDYITLDDGEAPLLAILNSIQSGKRALLRTLVREEGKVRLETSRELHDIPFRDTGTPTYDGLPLGKYLSLCEMPNPMHRLWSDGRWNKLTLAHGCYWKKCSFCDVSLDYIGRYEPAGADSIIDKIETLIQETGQTGFHFVDEAAPPALLVAMAQRLLERNVVISWWGNIRFERSFTPEVAELLKRSGCIAMSGGLEVASDRLLALMDKGVTVDQVARVTRAFAEHGIMVHAYLMFGFPTETTQETIDSLERVRQLFSAGCIQSGFWHRFAATIHSPVGKNPERFGVRLLPVPSTFARNDVAFEDPTGVDHDGLHPGLKKALYNYMLGLGLDTDVREWFDFAVPRPKVTKNWIANALSERRHGKTV